MDEHFFYIHRRSGQTTSSGASHFSTHLTPSTTTAVASLLLRATFSLSTLLPASGRIMIAASLLRWVTHIYTHTHIESQTHAHINTTVLFLSCRNFGYNMQGLGAVPPNWMGNMQYNGTTILRVSSDMAIHNLFLGVKLYGWFYVTRWGFTLASVSHYTVTTNSQT